MNKTEQAVIDLDGEWPDHVSTKGVLVKALGPMGAVLEHPYSVSFSSPVNGEYFDFICSHSEFMEARKRLENKPTEWEGDYLCQSRDGRWSSFHGEQPIPFDAMGDWFNGGVRANGAPRINYGAGHVFGDWRQSLEPRPQPDNKEGEGVEWDGKGVPPAGTVCRIEEWASTGEWILCDFDYRIDYVGHSHVVATTVGTPREVERVFTGVRFMPTQSHRDKVIEAAMKHTTTLCRKDVAAMYDAGMLKLPGDEQ